MRDITMRFLSKRPVAVILIFDLVFFLVCYRLVAWYYLSGLPYYDSVGSYWNMFSIMNTTNQSGLFEGIRQAIGYPLSWVQSFFAVVGAFIVPKTPQALMMLNFFALVTAQLSIYLCMKKAKCSNVQSLLLSFLTYLPGALMEWVGGYIDMRRDASMLSLLTASYFLTWRYVWDPGARGGIMLGTVIGLTQWSRGNALPYIAIGIGSPVLIWILSKKEKSTIPSMFPVLLVPLMVSLFFIAPFYWVHGKTVFSQYANHADIGGDRIASFLSFWNVASVLLFTSNPLVSKISMSVFSFFVILFIFLMKWNVFTIRRDFFTKERPRQLLFAGMLIFMSIMVFHIFVLGLIMLNGSASTIPFFPILIGLMSMICALSSGIGFHKNIRVYRWRNTAVWLSMVFLLAFSSLRVYLTMPSRDGSVRNDVYRVANEMKDILSGRSVAYLWLDHIHVHDLNFYITEQGRSPLYAPSTLASGFDTELPPRPNMTIEEQQQAFAQGIRSREFIVVSEDLSVYENPDGFFFMFLYGRPVIEQLLGDGTMKKIYTYTFNGIPFAVLENTAV